MPDELNPSPTVAEPAAAPALQPAPTAEPTAAPATDPGQPQAEAKGEELLLNIGGGKTRPVNRNDPAWQKEAAEKWWMIENFYTADERRMSRAKRKDRDLFMAALRGEQVEGKPVEHPLVEEVRGFFKTQVAPQPAQAAPAAAGTLWAKLDDPAVKEELADTPVLAAAINEVRQVSQTREATFAKMAEDYKALLDRVESGSGTQHEAGFDQADVFNLQADLRDLSRTPQGRTLLEKISQDEFGKVDVRRAQAVLAQEYAEMIQANARAGKPEPDFQKDIVEPSLRSYNISTDAPAAAAPAPKPEPPKAQPSPAGGETPPGGGGRTEDVVDESTLTPEQLRDRARAKFDGRKPTYLEKMRPGGVGRLHQRLVDSGIAPK